MIIKASDDCGDYIPIIGIGGRSPEMLLDFGLLRLKKESIYICSAEKERALMLLDGEARIRWGSEMRTINRKSMIYEKPSAIHLASGSEVEIVSISEQVEFAVFRVDNNKSFETIFYDPDSVTEVSLSSMILGNTAERVIRTVIDDDIAPFSKLCLGEVVNYAGKWSSYPPHYHPQPEIYHYRFFPQEGFGFSEHGEDVFKVRNGDTAAILPNATHSQVAAPGYTLIYLWAIPHLSNNRFKKDSRIYEKKHSGLLF